MTARIDKLFTVFSKRLHRLSFVMLLGRQFRSTMAGNVLSIPWPIEIESGTLRPQQTGM